MSTNTSSYTICSAPNVYIFVYILIETRIAPLKYTQETLHLIFPALLTALCREICHKLVHIQCIGGCIIGMYHTHYLLLPSTKGGQVYISIHPIIHPLHPSVRPSLCSSLHPPIQSFIHPPICPSVPLFLPSSTHPICPSVPLFLPSSTHPIIHPPTHLSVRPSVPPFIHPSNHSSTHPSVRPSLCSSLHPPIQSSIMMTQRLMKRSFLNILSMIGNPRISPLSSILMTLEADISAKP